MPIKAIVFAICFALCGLLAQLFGWAALVFLLAHNWGSLLYSGVYSLLASLVGSGFGIVAWVSFESWNKNPRAKRW